MVENVKAVFTPAVRQWLYRIAYAASFVLATFGVLDEQKLSALLYLVGAILVMADVNVNRAKVVTPDGEIHDTPSVPSASAAVVAAESDEPLVTVKTPVKKAPAKKVAKKAVEKL